jgi:hypothetical protein
VKILVVLEMHESWVRISENASQYLLEEDDAEE